MRRITRQLWPVVLAAVTVAPLAAAAQFGTDPGKPVGSSPTEPGERSRLEPARRILHMLVGRWRFDIRLAGNYDGPPDASGTRSVVHLFDDLRVAWAEAFDHSSLRGQGVLGFDPAANRFFSTGIYTSGATPELLTGTLDDASPSISFRAISGTPGLTVGQARVLSSVLSIVDHDHFTWAALDRGWHAVFTRQVAPQP